MEIGYQFRRRPAMLIFGGHQQERPLGLRESVKRGLPLF
jgi:hypothetical protein